MTYPEIGRRCAVCGRAQTPKLGGLAGFAAVIAILRDAGAPLKLPAARYAHVGCVRKAQRAVAKRRSDDRG